MHIRLFHSSAPKKWASAWLALLFVLAPMVEGQQFSADPDPLDVVVGQGATGVDTFTLLNGSGQTINFETTLEGVITLSPGGEYQWKDSDVPGGPAYVWNDISSTGTLLSDLSDMDDGYEPFNLSFLFPFYGTTFAQVYVSSNGYITFGSGSSSYSNSQLPSSSSPANMVAAFFDDLNLGSGGDVYYLDNGSECIIQFEQAALYSGGGEVTFQIVLKDDGEILLYYKAVTGTLTSASVGIQNGGMDQGVQVAYDEAYLKNTHAVKFYQSHQWLTVDPMSGMIGAGLDADIEATFHAGSLAPGLYEGVIRVSHDLSGQGDLEIPVSMEIDSGPTVNLTSPQTSMSFIEGGDVPLAAVASDNGSITKVEFYRGATKLHEVAGAPYEWTWENALPGTHAITARAYDDLNGVGISSVVSINVQADSDADGMGDAWEEQYFYGLGQDGGDDYDGDSVSNLLEFQLGLRPDLEDSDGDGMTDSEEVTHGTQPMVEDSFDDDDGDRYPNIYEVKNGSNPLSASSAPTPHYVVNPAGGGTHVNIQSALNSASGTYTEYKIIQVVPGTYTGSNNTGLNTGYYKPLLISSQGAAVTVLNCQNQRRGLTLQSDSVVEGFTIVNGRHTQGAAVYNSNTRSRLINCVFLNNHADSQGGVLYNEYGSPMLVHCTAQRNSAGGAGHGIYSGGGATTVANSILWNNATSEIATAGSAAMQVSYSFVRGGYVGQNNFNVDPLLTRDGHLSAASAAMNAGEEVNTSSVDMDGEQRPLGSHSDIGADEWLDSDADGMADYWEIRHIGNLSANGTEDPDSDGLAHLEEFIFSSNPTVADSDGDGVNDGTEAEAGSDPWNTDSDGDGMSDKYEIDHGLNPADDRDALDDHDGDRIPNLYEAVHNTDADDPVSVPAPHYTVAAIGGTHSNISAAIGAAKSAAGDCKIIRIMPGIYSEGNLSLNTKRIMLMGDQTASPPMVATATASLCVNIGISGSVVDGLVLTHTGESAASGISVNMAAFGSQARLVNCVITGNASSNGAGVYLSAGHLFVDHSTIHRNRSPSWDGQGGEGRGIYVAGYSKLYLCNSIVWNPTTAENSSQIFKSTNASVESSGSIVWGGEHGSSAVDPLLDRYGYLKPGSPAIKPVGGINLPVSAKDILGNTRAQPNDLGAAEYVDSDNDGMPDWWEIRFLNGLGSDGSGDLDSDGLTDEEEYLFGSNPAVGDTDGDGASDFAEHGAGSEPWTLDTDLDGMSDGYEIENGLEPTEWRDALEDKDGDRIPNLYEFARGTAADDFSSKPPPDYTVGLAGGTHSSISAAIDAAENVAAGYRIVLVKPGVYDEELSVGYRPVLLLGEQGFHPPVIASSGYGSPIMVHGKNVVVEGFVISRQGSLSNAAAVRVEVLQHEQVRLSNCIIRNTVTYGGAVSLGNGQISIVHSTISGNSASDYGAGINVGGGTLFLKNSIVWNPDQTEWVTQIYEGSAAEVQVSDSIVLGGEFGALSTDPLLTYSGLLTLGSPAINAGGLGASTPRDIHGEARIALPDIGADEFVDSDGDTLSDQDEWTLHGTDPGLTDTDGDGLDDNVELEEYDSNPLHPDTDGDGLEDADEIFVHLTSPRLVDTDEDGMPDGWELTYGLNPLADDSAGDSDMDQLTNIEEYVAGTDPTEADSDSDGVDDADELLLHGTDPLKADSDGDGLNDGAEINTHNTDPLQADSDGDGIDDGWEIQHSLNPLVDDAGGNSDGDDLSNLEEYLSDRDPALSDTPPNGGVDALEVFTRLE